MPRVKWGAKKWNEFKWGGTSFAIIGGVLYDKCYGLEIEDNLTHEVNVASFGIITSYASRPIGGQTVDINWDAVKIFSGRVISVEPEKLNNSEWFFQVTCEDYTKDLDKKLVVEDYGSNTLYNIVKDIIDTYVDGITYNNVIDNGTTLSGIKFNYLYPSQCFQQIADRVGWDWYIDVNKDLHFFPQETNDAPMELTDANYDFDELKIIPDTSQLANRIFVRGGRYLSSTYNQDPITAVAGQTEFPVRYRPYEFTVTVNAVSKTVGIENVDTPGTFDFILNPDEKILKVDQIVMSGGEAVAMFFKYKIPLLQRVDDVASQQSIANIEGGDSDGIYEKLVIDENITEIAIAEERGKAELVRYSNIVVSGSFTTFQSGFLSGQRVHIQLTDRNIDEYYLVRRVTTMAIGGNELQYTVEFATFLLGFTWLIAKILDATQKVVEREDEVLNVLRVIRGEECTMDDATPVTTLDTPPFEWGPGGSPQAYWGRFQWG